MKYELKRAAIQLVAGMALFASASSLGAPAGETRRNAPSVTIYDPDPNHPWNRVHACLLVRRANDDSEYGADTLDPLLWRETKHLLTGDSHRRALECLDEFLKGHAEKSITDPLKRAVFQRDLWAVFDWAAFGGNHPSTQRRALLARLALAMHRVALTPEEIRRLPETYSEAVASHHFSVEYSSTSPHRAFLPPTLFQPDGPWIGLSGYSDEPTAIGHFSGRSRFLIFMRLPGGREATLRYVRSLRSSTEPPSLDGGRGLNLKLPQFPAGTEVALVRQMMLIDANGNLTPTAVTESVQLRVYHDVTSGPAVVNFENGPASHDQDSFEFRLSRLALFTRRDGGLIPAQPGEKEFPALFTFGDDPIENARALTQRRAILSCIACHSDSGIHSVPSRIHWMNGNQGSNQPGWNPSVLDVIDWETAKTIDLERKQDRFLLFQKYWNSSDTERRSSSK
jgi:hypothetical protein